MTKDEALNLAIEVLQKNIWCDDDCNCSDRQAITAIKEALAQRTWVEIDGDDWIKALEMADFDKVAAFEFFENKLKELNT